MQRCVNISRPGGGFRGRVSGVLEILETPGVAQKRNWRWSGKEGDTAASAPGLLGRRFRTPATVEVLALALWALRGGVLPSTDTRAVRKGQLRWLGTCLALTHRAASGVSCEREEIRLRPTTQKAHHQAVGIDGVNSFPHKRKKKNLQMINGNWAAGPKGPLSSAARGYCYLMITSPIHLRSRFC